MSVRYSPKQDDRSYWFVHDSRVDMFVTPGIGKQQAFSIARALNKADDADVAQRLAAADAEYQATRR